MRNSHLKLICIAMCLCLLSGCAPYDSSSQYQEFAPSEENRLVVYTSHKEDVYKPIIKEFEERTGIWVSIISGGTNEILDRIANEADEPKADVMFGGGVDSLVSYGEYFTPYACKEIDAIQENYRSPNNLWVPFSSLPITLIYNKKLVSPGRVRNWEDLLDESFRGEIAFADPEMSGSCFTGLFTYLYALNDENALQRFAENLNGNQLDSSSAILTTVANGTNLVGVTLEETAMQRIVSGDEIAIVYPEDGTSSIPDGSALIKGAEHEENAKLFLDFTVSHDIQKFMTHNFYRRSVRKDIENDESLVPIEDINLLEYDVKWVSENREATLMSWAFFLDKEE